MTFDVRKLVVHQIKANNGHGLLDASLVLLQHLESVLKGGSCLDLPTTFLF